MAKGVDFVIKVNKGTREVPSYVKVAGQRGGKLNRSGDTIDVTTKDDEGWKNNRVGLLEWSIDGDGLVVVDDEGYTKLEEAFLNRKPVLVQFGGATGVQFTGEAVITDFPLDAPYDDELSYSIKLQGCGALNKTGADSLVAKAKSK